MAGWLVDLDGGERGQVKGLETCVPDEAVSDMGGTMNKLITKDDLEKDRDDCPGLTLPRHAEMTLIMNARTSVEYQLRNAREIVRII